MHVGISAWRLQGQRLGIGRYIEYMVRQWAHMLSPPDRLTLFVHSPPGEDIVGLSDSLSVRVVTPRLTNALWENLLLPWHARDVDVVFGPSYTLPLTFPGPCAMTLHSVDEAQPGAISRWHNYTYGLKYRLSARKADAVIVNAESSKEHVHRLYGVPLERIHVVWLGVDKEFRPIDDESVLAATRRRLTGADRPYILFVGGLSRRRNIPTLLEAFALLRRKHDIPHALVLFGSNRGAIPLEQMCSDLKITDSVFQSDGRVAHHREIVPVYAAAAAFAHISESEGFPLTVAEAMSCGTPVVAVNRAGLGEVAHGFALTIERPDVNAVADALLRVLTDAALAQDLRCKGVERARLFSWDLAARRTLDILRTVAT